MSRRSPTSRSASSGSRAELQAATERRNVADIARLGKEYDNARAALDRAWAAWKT